MMKALKSMLQESMPQAMAQSSPYPDIWLIEDNLDDILFTTIVLEELRVQNPLVTSRDEIEAKQQLLSYQQGLAASIIFIDINLPCADGFDLLQTICNEPSLENSVKVILSGGGSKEDAARSTSLGADFYLTKPFHFKHLQHIAAESSKVAMDRRGQGLLFSHMGPPSA